VAAEKRDQAAGVVSMEDAALDRACAGIDRSWSARDRDLSAGDRAALIDAGHRAAARRDAANQQRAESALDRLQS
jgi:hypothetical protein